MQLADVKPRMMAFAANMTIARYFGRRYTASRYTFSPPERGNIVPNSSQIKSPQNERRKPATQSNRDAPTEPTDSRMLEGVENMPVPIIRPMLCDELARKHKDGTVVGESRVHEHCATKDT
jgi:hypothetical protein